MKAHPWTHGHLAPASTVSHVYRDFHGIEPPVVKSFDERKERPLPIWLIHAEDCPCRKPGAQA